VAEPFAPHVNDQRAALLGVLSNLEPDDWQRATVCDPWTIHDVGAHLVENELLFGRLYRGETDESASENDAAVERWRKVDAETVRYSIWHHGQATQRVIDSRPEASWGREVGHHGRPIELRRALRMHFFELAVHSHDITGALGVPATWGARAAPLVDYCVELAPAALALTSPSGAIELHVTDVGTRTLDGSSGEWTLSAVPVGTPAATWHTDAESLVLAVTGRLEPDEAMRRTNVEGDAAMLREILAAWQLAG
jgi:uncharacterized protein (TIGR03083 family)